MSRNPTVTIYDVAQRAGVSISTVSHSLNRPDRVSAVTRARVMAAVEDLGFVPKAAAVSRARKGHGRVGVLAPFTSYPSYFARLGGAMSALRDKGVDLVVFDHDSVASSTAPLLESLPITDRLDGIIIMGIPLDPGVYQRLAERRIATVMVDSPSTVLNSVEVDDEQGGDLLGAHLAELGHHHVAFVSEPQRSTSYVSPGQLRLLGFERALTERLGDAVVVERLTTPTLDRSGVAGVVDELLERAPDRRPTALFGHFDDIAAALVGELQRHGVVVPDEMSVVGYDGGALAEALDLTTVSQPFAETGEAAADLLLSTFADPDAPTRQLRLRASLQIGRTTGPCPTPHRKETTS
jgi:LacI family transcriptional regulator